MTGSRTLTRDCCWRFKCDDEPDGWIHGDGRARQVCEEHGEQLENGGWERYVPADSEQSEGGGSP